MNKEKLATEGAWNHMSWYVYRIYPTRTALITEGPNEEENSFLDRHFSYLKEHTSQGTVLLAGLTTKKELGGLAIVIFKAESEDAAQDFMNNDPAFKAGVFHGDVLPFHVSLLNATGLDSKR